MRAIGWGGLWCGVLDITAAFVTWGMRGVSSARVLQSIARGLLGPATFKGGMPAAMLGLALHFFIAFSAAAVYWFASRRMPVLASRPVPFGVLYGIAVYGVMYWIVMPLSAAPPSRAAFSATAIAIVTHIFCVGLPIAWATHRYPKG